MRLFEPDVEGGGDPGRHVVLDREDALGVHVEALAPGLRAAGAFDEVDRDPEPCTGAAKAAAEHMADAQARADLRLNLQPPLQPLCRTPADGAILAQISAICDDCPALSGVSTRGTDWGFSRREDFWFIVAAKERR
jgi:hypothetical protein